MANQNALKALPFFLAFLKKAGLKKAPGFHIVLGSGFGAALDHVGGGNWVLKNELSFSEIPGLPRSTVQDHAGKFKVYENAKGQSAIFQFGRIHGYEGHAACDVVMPVMLARLSGVSNFLLTNAAGGVSAAFNAGDAMLIRDQVNMTGQNPLTGENPVGVDKLPLGPRFPDMGNAYDSKWRADLKTILANAGLRVHDGIYMGLLGPSFETPAEVTLFNSWGIHAVGMSTVWETIALKHSGARVAGLSLISNAAAGMGDGAPLDHSKILETCRVSAAKIMTGVLGWLEKEMSV
jgi:purine-nucleoside phosphorylase